MQGSLDNPPIIIRAKRMRGLLILPIALLMGFSAFGMINTSGLNAPAVGLLLVALVFVLFAGWQIIRPARLEIGPEGLAQTVLWRTARFSWRDVFNFRAVSISLTRKLIGFDYVTAPKTSSVLRNLNKSMFGIQGSLQSGWERPAVEVAELLNRAREHWLYGAQAVESDGPRPAVQKIPIGGRMGRKPYLIASVVIMTISIAITLFSHGQASSSGMSVVLIWLYAGRLHDIGRSAWWQLIFYAVAIGAPIALIFANQSSLVVNGASLGLQFLITFGLGLVPGDPGPNRFGPAPGQATAAAESEVFR